MEKKLKEAVNILCKELAADSAYYDSWKANIAMTMYDEYMEAIKPTTEQEAQDDPDEVEENRLQMLEIANKAADRFLKLLCS